MRRAASFCALCTADIPAGQERSAPFGKDDALVTVCATCDDEPAREHRGPERTYEGAGSATGIDAALDAARRRTPRLAAMAEADKRGGMAPEKNGATPGWIRVLIPKCDENGRARDNKEAWAIAVKRYGSELRHVANTDRGYFVFERPDRKHVAELRRGKPNPIAALEPYRRKGAQR